MSMTDPIADMLSRIRNGAAVRKSSVLVPFSRLKHQIAEILVKEGWIRAVEKIDAQPQSQLKITLKYDQDGRSVVQTLTRISKPGRRVYVSRDRIPVVMNRLGMSILSTSKGIMSGHAANKAKIGGEVICEIS